MQLCTQIFKPLLITVITMDVVNFLSLSSVASVHDYSDGEEIIAAVGGVIAFVSAHQQSQHASVDMDQNGCQRRKKHRGSLT